MSADRERSGVIRSAESRPLLVDVAVEYHLRAGAARDDSSLITVTHTPNAVSTHLVASESAPAPTVRMEQGRVVTKVETEDYGTLISVVGGPAVVEIALHHDGAQKTRYLQAVQAVDAETRQHTLDAVQSFAMPIVLAVIQQLGVVDDATVDDSAQTDGEDPA